MGIGDWGLGIRDLVQTKSLRAAPLLNYPSEYSKGREDGARQSGIESELIPNPYSGAAKRRVLAEGLLDLHELGAAGAERFVRHVHERALDGVVLLVHVLRIGRDVQQAGRHFTCPLVLATLGLFVFLLNGLMLWLTAVLSAELGLGFRVDGIVPAILGALVVGVVSAVLSVFVGKRDKERRRKRE